jgi:adiponectin receptor
LRGNKHITHWYRGELTWAECVRSIWEMHNETANVWSHLLGACVFAWLTGVSLWRAVFEPESEYLHRATVVLLCCGATVLCSASALFHTVCCRSLELYQLTAKLDYTGISLMILTSFFPVLLNLFFCQRGLALIYSIAITGLVALAVFVSWDQRFSSPTPWFTRLRALLFVALGLFGFVPVPHAALLHGFQHSWPVIWPLLLMALIYIMGAAIYATHFPELLCRPGHCNTGCHSHVIFHVCALVAAVVHYYAVDKLFLWRVANGRCV